VIVRMGLLQKRSDISSHDFRRHWRDSHGPLAARLPGLRRYHQNYVVDRAQRGITYARGGHDFDGFSELWFDDLPSMSAAFATEQVQQLGEDEDRFIGELKLITAIQARRDPKAFGLSTHQAHVDAETTRGYQLGEVHDRVVRRPLVPGEKIARG
jgi:uncharacterized protein (TIGR02118 family)